MSQTVEAVYNQWEHPLARSFRGTNLEFKLSPTITALSPAFSSGKQDTSIFDVTSLNSIGLLDNLATDFARALKDLSLILADLRLLSAFGDLPIALTTTESGPILRVRFPGCDADLVSQLCDEVGVRRGVIVEDEAWSAGKDVEMALLFPFAPMGAENSVSDYDDGREYFTNRHTIERTCQPEELDWRQMLSPAKTPSTHSYSTLHSPPKKAAVSPSDYESLRASDFGYSDDGYDYDYPSSVNAPTHSTAKSQDYEGLEGIYKFLQVCEDSRR